MRPSSRFHFRDALLGGLVASAIAIAGAQIVDQLVTESIELTTAPVDITSGTGQPSGGNNGDVFITTDNGGEMHQNVSGTWTLVGSGGGGGGGGGANNVTLVRKATSETLNTDVTLQDDDELFFSIGVSETRIFTMLLAVESASNVPDIKMAFTIPSGATMDWCVEGFVLGAPGNDADTRRVCRLQDETTAVGMGVVAFEHGLVIEGTIINSTTAGTVQLQWAQNTSNATNTQVTAGSFLSHWPETSSGALANVVLTEKAADELVNNTTTLQDDDHLTFEADANTDYEVVFNMAVTCATAADFKFALTAPSGTTGWMMPMKGDLAINTSGVGSLAYRAEETILTVSRSAGTAGTGVPVGVQASYFINVSSTAGSVAVQWAQEVANVSDCTVQAGSWMRVTTLGGLSAVNVSDTHANRPAAGSAGRLFFPTNAPYLARDNGTTWDLWAPMFPIVEPDDSDFSWVNQGGATVSTVNGGIYLFMPNSATTNVRLRTVTAPSTPWTATAFVRAAVTESGGQFCGLAFYETGTGEIVGWGPSGQTNGNSELESHKYTNTTTYNSQYGLFEPAGAGQQGVWLRIGDDGTDRLVEYSVDGQNFIGIHQVGRTDFLTADEVGFFCHHSNNSITMGMLVLSWEIN